MDSQSKRKKYSALELSAISSVLSNSLLVKYVPKLFTSIECIEREEDVLFLVRVPRRHVSQVKRRVTNWPYFRSKHYENIKFEVRAIPGIE